MHDGDGVEVGQAISHISEDAGLVRERDVGVCLRAPDQGPCACTP